MFKKLKLYVLYIMSETEPCVYELLNGEELNDQELSEALLVVKGNTVRLYYYDHPAVEMDRRQYELAELNYNDIHVDMGRNSVKVLPGTESIGYLVVHLDLGDGPEESRYELPTI